MIDGLASGLVVAGVLVFFGLLRTGANRPAKRDTTTGDLVLQCGPTLIWVMGLIAVLGPLSMGALSFIIPFKNKSQVFVPIGIGGFFLLLGGFICLWALKRRTRISGQGLTSEYIFAVPQFLPWEQVAKVDFASGQEFWVRGTDGKKALLHVWFTGVKEAVPLLRAHLPEAVQEQSKAVIDRFACVVGA